MIKDVYNSIKLSIIERTSSPVLGVFITSWLAYNWKTVAFATWGGDIELDQRVDTVEALLSVETGFMFGTTIPEHLYGPFWFTLLFAFLYPVLSPIPYYVWQKSDSIKQSIRSSFESQQLLSVEQSNKLRREIREAESDFNDTIEKYRLQYEDATKSLGEVQDELSDREQLIDNLRSQKKESDKLIEDLQQELAKVRSAADHTPPNNGKSKDVNITIKGRDVISDETGQKVNIDKYRDLKAKAQSAAIESSRLRQRAVEVLNDVAAENSFEQHLKLTAESDQKMKEHQRLQNEAAMLLQAITTAAPAQG